MAVDRRMFRRLIGRVRRHEALTGQRIGRSTLQSLFEAELSTTQARSQKTAEFEFRREQEETRKAEFGRREERLGEEAKRTARGARLLGAARLTTAGIEIGKTKRGAALFKGATTAGRELAGAGRAVAGRFIPSLTPAAPAGTAPFLGTPLATEAGGTFLGATTAAPLQTTAAVPSVAGAGLAVGAAGFAGAEVGKRIFRGEPKAGAIGGGIAAGAAAGAKIGAFGGLPGAFIGGVIGGVSGAISAGTVICTELWRQGYIPTKVVVLDSHDKHDDLTEKIYSGYMRWAPYVVKAMQKSRIVTWFVKPFGVGWAYHMAHRLDKNIPDSWIGKVVYKIGVPACRWLGRNK